MRIAIALVCLLGCSGLANAQCENGVCLLPKVGLVETIREPWTYPLSDEENEKFRFIIVGSAPVAPVTSVAAVSSSLSSEDCGCHGQCGRPGCTCAPVEVASSVQTFAVAAVPMRTPIRTVLAAPFRARPLQRLFRCR
jgi:hypothetical protein